MKPVGSFSRLAAFGLALSMFVVSSAHAAEGKAVVRAIRGVASYSENGGEYKSLRVGKVLGSGSAVRTAASSQVDLFLGDNGPVVRITADTTLEFDKLTLDRGGADVIIETELDLKSGTILGNVKKLADASRYEVKTPTGVAAIRGTEYQISADGVVHVVSGSVLVVYTNPSTKVVTQHAVNAGETFTPPTDPSVPGATPVVGPTPPGTQIDLPPIIIPDDGSTPVVVISPEPFVSPQTGTEASSSTGGTQQ